jgi:hypothetical protein
MSMSMSMSMSKSKVVSKLDLELLSKKYNFEVEEALLFLNEENSKKNSSVKSKELVSKYPMPFNGEKKKVAAMES